MGKRSEIIEQRGNYAYIVSWASKHFSEGDLLVTIGLMKVKNVKRFIGCRINVLEKNLFLRSGEKIVRFVVLVLDDGYQHIHMLMKNYPYVNQTRELNDFGELVHHEFSKHLHGHKTVQVDVLKGGGWGAINYSVCRQGDVEVMFEECYLPA